MTDRDQSDGEQGQRGAISSLAEILALGLRIVPARANSELLAPLKSATRDARTIAAWLTTWPHADLAWAVPPSIVAVTTDNRYRKLAQFGGRDASSAKTPSIANEHGGATLLYSATAGSYRALTLIDDARIEIAVGSHVLLPTAGSGRWWIKPFGATPLARAPDWADHAALESTPKERCRAGRRPSQASRPHETILLADAGAVARALGSRKRRGRDGNYQARCPAHDDRDPSLSLRNGDDGRLMLHCFGGCSFFEIVEALKQHGVLPGGDA